MVYYLDYIINICINKHESKYIIIGEIYRD